MKSITPVGTGYYPVVGLLLVFWLACGPAGPSGGVATVRLDPDLAAVVSDTRIALTVIDHDPNVIWSVIGLKTGYTGMDGLVQKFLLAADSSSVAHVTLDSRGRAGLGKLPPGSYWVTTSRLVSVGDERLLWSLPLVVDSSYTGAKDLVFHRSNAALALGPDDTPL